jgi:DUF4097 and DUF4098 domain-containing protein YvlB
VAQGAEHGSPDVGVDLVHEAAGKEGGPDPRGAPRQGRGRFGDAGANSLQHFRHRALAGVQGPLDASTGSGNLRISKIGDEVKASTGSGHIEVDGVKGSVRASTGSGTIRALGVAGGLHATTGSGNVTLEQTAPGDVEVSTGSGSVELRGVHGSVRAQTASGNINVDGEGSRSWRLGTASGGVTVRLPGRQGFNLHAHSVSGSIYTAREMTVQGTLSKHELEGKVGDGGFLLEVSTVSGPIRIE